MSSLQKPPSWRWDVAKSATESINFSPSSDNAVLAARRFLTRWVRCRTAFDWDFLATQMPNVFGAFSIYDENGPVRHALEARILADESARSIAAKAGFSAKVMQTYEDLFFDVRGRLSHVDFILNQVIGRDFRGPRGDTPYFVFWKVFGYLGGRAILDSLMGAAPIARRPANPDEVDAFFNWETQRSLGRKMAQAVQRLDPGSREQFQSIAMAMHQVREERKDKEGDKLDNFEIHLKAFLEGIPWVVGSQAEKCLDPTLLDYDNYAAELRADELQLLASGTKVPGLEALKNLKPISPRPKTAPATKLD